MELFASLVISALVAHFIGDFVLQSEWMASGKSSSLLPLVSHIGAYTITLWLVMTIASAVIFSPHIATVVMCKWLIQFAAINGAAHFVVDFVSSRLSRWARENGKMRLFWIIIGADQLFHQLVLVLSIIL